MPRVAYVCQPKAYCDHYGHGYLQPFTGDLVQEGFGVGGLLAGLFRKILPLLKNTVLPAVKRAAKHVGKNLLTSGAHVVKDVILEKQNIKHALKRRTKDALHKIIGGIGKGKAQTGKGYITKKKVCRAKRSKLKKDIFD